MSHRIDCWNITSYMLNCYKILGVKDFSSLDEIKTAYRKLSKKFHPDVNDGDKFFEEKFKELQNAYEILTDTAQKKIHDERLRQTQGSPDIFDTGQQKKQTNKDNSRPTTAATNGKNQQAHGGAEQKKPSAGTSETQTTRQPQKKQYASIVLGILTTIVIATIIALVNNTKRDSIEYNSSKNRAITPAQYPDQVRQEVSDKLPKSKPNEISVNDNALDNTTAPSDTYFHLGSNKQTVLQIQGNPTTVNKIEAIGIETWYYGLSSVTFKNGRVSEFSNSGDNLQVRMSTTRTTESTLTFFTIGSIKDQVLAVQGQPTSISKIDAIGIETWYYGLNSVTFKNGRVHEYSNSGGDLQIRMTASGTKSKMSDYYTIGSTKNQVLEVQGTPTEITKIEAIGVETWFYGLSSITFKNGRVSEYSNTGGNLLIRS